MAINAVIFDYGKVLSNSEDPAGEDRSCWRSPASTARPSTATTGAIVMNTTWAALNGRTYWEKFASEAGIARHSGADRRPDRDRRRYVDLAQRGDAGAGWSPCRRRASRRRSSRTWGGRSWPTCGRSSDGWLTSSITPGRASLASANRTRLFIFTPARSSGSTPNNALFLDDKPENIAAAAEVGLNAVLFESIEQLRRDLAARGLQEGLPVPGAVPDFPRASETHTPATDALQRLSGDYPDY